MRYMNMAKICVQILHTGCYAYNPALVAPSAVQAPINPFKPMALDAQGIEKQIQDFIDTSIQTQKAGYDGAQKMGFEGYFLNPFIAARSNHRDDEWGGSYQTLFDCHYMKCAEFFKLWESTSSLFTVCRCWTWLKAARLMITSSS